MEAFEHVNYQGASERFRGETPFVGPAWNDRAKPDPEVERAVLSPDGRFVAGHSMFSGHAVWDVRTGERVLAAAGGNWEAAFDPALLTLLQGSDHSIERPGGAHG